VARPSRAGAGHQESDRERGPPRDAITSRVRFGAATGAIRRGRTARCPLGPPLAGVRRRASRDRSPAEL